VCVWRSARSHAFGSDITLGWLNCGVGWVLSRRPPVFNYSYFSKYFQFTFLDIAQVIGVCVWRARVWPPFWERHAAAG
jgi:hypothetical protein